MRLLLAIPLLLATPLFPSEKQEFTWGELSSLTGRTIRIAVPQKDVLTGKLTAIQPEGLVLQIQKTTDKGAYPKGRFVVPREQVKVLDVLSKRKRGRVIGTIAGAWLGLGLGGYAAVRTDSTGGALALLAGVGGGLTMLGYYVGDVTDSNSTTILVRQ